ncbi:YraN family protein [Candidatus Thioglobus sp.]|nr:YraN family protein [Candidatus Thioglobus sp.]MDB3893514.1 YraN family protein [Candidatus Thioglobus sp.]MDC0388780.1 YraN family protein [Candidatus Thioglobus sp.]MDC0904567.1 YraN family protein [Candidatus Thioglobus sp.]MDC0920465.1 YraN family protein [Candidatus Thioglobus sp.]
MFSIKRQVGNQAEDIALKHLIQQGLTLIEQNYLTKVGEIDIIMLDKFEQVLVFVEVRYRKNTLFGSAIETITPSKQTKIIRSAQRYLQQHDEFDEYICRFDVVGLESDLKYPKINWIKDAFDG